MSREATRWNGKVGKNLNYFHLIVPLFLFLFFSLIVINQGSLTFHIPMSLICSELFCFIAEAKQTKKE